MTLHYNKLGKKEANDCLGLFFFHFEKLPDPSVSCNDGISNPIKKLSDGIKAIADKNYSKRIVIQRKDEFRELANSFNNMAARLDEYEHSNLSQIKFEKKY